MIIYYNNDTTNHVDSIQQIKSDPSHKIQTSGNKAFGLNLPEFQAGFRLAMVNEPKPQTQKLTATCCIHCFKVSSDASFG